MLGLGLSLMRKFISGSKVFVSIVLGNLWDGANNYWDGAVEYIITTISLANLTGGANIYNLTDGTNNYWDGTNNYIYSANGYNGTADYWDGTTIYGITD